MADTPTNVGTATQRRRTGTTMNWFCMIVVFVLFAAVLTACGAAEDTTGEAAVDIEPLEAATSPSPEAEMSPSPEAEASPSPEAEMSPSPEAEASPSDVESVAIDDLTANSAAYYGRTVSVDGVVRESDNGQAFTLVRTPSDPNPVLVVPASGGEFDTQVSESDAVQVVGEVRTYNAAELEQELGVSSELATRFDGQTVIAASSLEQTSAEGEASASPSPDTEVSPATESQVTLSEIRDNLEQYDGQTVTVEGEVEEILSPSSFTLIEPGAQVSEEFAGLVVVMRTEPGADQVGVQRGQQVQVTGTVDSFSTDAVEKEEGYHTDQTALFEEYIGHAALVGSQLQTLDQ